MSNPTWVQTDKGEELMQRFWECKPLTLDEERLCRFFLHGLKEGPGDVDPFWYPTLMVAEKEGYMELITSRENKEEWEKFKSRYLAQEQAGVILWSVKYGRRSR